MTMPWSLVCMHTLGHTEENFRRKPQRESTGYRFGHSFPVRVKDGIPVPGIDFHGCLSE